MRTLFRYLALHLVVAALALVVPALALAQDAGDLVGAVGQLWPATAPWLALLPVVQLAAKLLAPLPARVGGYTHSTWWSRFWDTVAAFPAAPAPRAAKVTSEAAPETP